MLLNTSQRTSPRLHLILWLNSRFVLVVCRIFMFRLLFLLVLQTGEAIVFAPSGLCIYGSGLRVVGQYGRRYLHVQVRRRITEDGGESVLVV